MKDNKVTVLYVDDEEENLNSFMATFRREYNISTAISGVEGLKKLESKEYQVIISDQRMPSMTGVEFFEIVTAKYPKAIKILLTGYSDMEAAIAAINKGGVYQFLDKPWDVNLLKITIDNAYQKYMTESVLTEKIAALDKANQELSRFVYSVSHELRAPLMSILGIVNIAGFGADTEKLMEYFGMIGQSVEKLDIFIRNIIEYHQNKKIDASHSEVNLEKMVDEILGSISNYSNFGSVSIIKDYRIEETFYSTPFRVRIILGNLLSNAVKFQKQDNPDKRIRISVETDKKEARFTIEDNGSGVREEDKDKLFRMFFKAQNNNSGTGIGLYIVKEAVDLLKGSVSVETNIEGGLTFKITIPNEKS